MYIAMLDRTSNLGTFIDCYYITFILRKNCSPGTRAVRVTEKERIDYIIIFAFGVYDLVISANIIDKSLVIFTFPYRTMFPPT